jgi:hypothetical protein
MNIRIQSCAFVSISDALAYHLTIQGERDQSWALIRGDNNRSMVTASSLADRCQGPLDGEGVDDLLQSMRDLGEIYVDLES